MSEKDKTDIRWGVKNDIDYIAASFVRKAADVEEIRSFVAELMKEAHPTDHATRQHPLIISKIESTEALVNFDSVLAASDGIMVARGDLGVEIPMETLAGVQKQVWSVCTSVCVHECVRGVMECRNIIFIFCLSGIRYS
jgi:pyruvate kinase